MKIKYLSVILFVFLGITPIIAQYTNLLDFNVSNGAYPVGALTINNYKLYGMASEGGANDLGCIFSIDTNGGDYKDLMDFNSVNGAYPTGSLLLVNGRLIGMAQKGGRNDSGCIFSVDTNGKGYKDLYDFTGARGKWPEGSLIVKGGKLYGMTQAGGQYEYGCVFTIDTSGNNYSNIFNFNGTTGSFPTGDLICEGKILYGMTLAGGLLTDGNIFSIDTNGIDFKDLFDFNGTNGQYPNGSLTFTNSGKKLCGMTSGGGSINGPGVIFSIDTNGANFKDIYIFSNSSGLNPAFSALVLSGDLLYGMANMGGTNNDGVVFSVDTIGNNYTKLLDFNGTNGAYPFGSVTLFKSSIYGMTQNGGSIDSGRAFKLQISSGSASINQISAGQIVAKLYPNPNNGQFTIQLSQNKGAYIIEIYNFLCDEIYNKTLNKNSDNNEINIGEQAPGVYLYYIVNQDAKIINSGKFIIY